MDLSYVFEVVNILFQFSLKAKNRIFIKISKIIFDKLEPPYDSQCRDYGKGSRFDCLNDCYRDLYYQTLGCIPTKHSLLTINLKKEFNYYYYKSIKFCKNQTNNENNLNQIIAKRCHKKCSTDCNDIYYENDYEIIHQYSPGTYLFSFKASYYTKIIYSPKTTFYSLIIDMANIWNLWNGISFLKLLFMMFKISDNYMRKITMLLTSKINIRLKTANFKVNQTNAI